MGNWRTVNMTGSMSAEEAADCRKILDGWEGFETPAACFSMFKSICGINWWVKENGTIEAYGNLAERDFDNDDIETGLKFLAEKYPSMELTLHSGSDWESLTCSATFVVKNGEVQRLAPQVEELKPIRCRPLSDFF